MSTNSLVENIKKIESGLQCNNLIKNIRYLCHNENNAYEIDFDDSKWPFIDGELRYKKDVDTLWVRFDICIPEKIMGIQIKNSPLRLMSVFQAPITVWCNGIKLFSEEYWCDFRNPEIILDDNACSGREYKVAFKIKSSDASFTSNVFFVESYLTNIDNIRYNCTLFLSELNYVKLLDGSHQLIEEIEKYIGYDISQIASGETSAEGLTLILDKARKIGEKIRLKAKQNKVYMIGHAHIDMNWLWPESETKKLISRDFETVCNMMDDYPQFKFSQSQCAAYKICEENYPKLFERVKKKISEGSWDVTASSWVENDSNMPLGEDITRQILYSRQYTQKKFGIKSEVMWAPDTFGHSANLPQIMRKCGIKYYFFMRCGLQTIPDHIEMHGYGKKVSDQPIICWKGIDGSVIIAANVEYNAEFIPSFILRNVYQNIEQKRHISLFVYGVGDHGGAPSRRDIERAIFANKSPMFPQLIFSSAQEYFENAKKEIDFIPVRIGEMNTVFEGCYTSHSDIKERLRKLSSLLYKAEILIVSSKNYDFSENIKSLWKVLLFHQFHDIIAGCAISMTYEDVRKKLDDAILNTQNIINSITTKNNDNVSEITILNLIASDTNEIIHIKEENVNVYNNNGKILPVQKSADGGTYVNIDLIKGLTSLPLILKQASNLINYGKIIETDDYYSIENSFYYVELKKNSGQFITFYDKMSKRYLCRKNMDSWRTTDLYRLNTFVLYHESPVNMSAWVIGPPMKVEYVTNRASSSIIDDGYLVQKIRFKHFIHASEIIQDIIFESNSPVIKFNNIIDWHERGNAQNGIPCLRIAFTPQIDNKCVVNEVPFAALERSARNAEYPNLRWSAICDEIGGAVLLNNSRYGIQCGGNKLELTLLRSGWEPDELPDMGKHIFSYQFYAFNGELKDSGVLHYADILHINPIEVVGNYEFSFPFVFVDLPKNIAVSTIKASEKNNNNITIRIYESMGVTTICTIQLKKGFYASETDEMEENEIEVYYTSLIDLKFTPYEIKTIIIKGRK